MKLIHTCMHATQFGILATAVYEEGEMTDDKRGTDTTYFVVCLRGANFLSFSSRKLCPRNHDRIDWALSSFLNITIHGFKLRYMN